jgi:SAM-dependent methyltransferase
LRAGETVIDLGSGPGLDAMLAAREVGPDGEVIGVDMTPAMIETATRNARALDAANVRFVLGDIEALPLPDASADVVLSNCVINLAPDKSRVFREAYRVLKPGGRFVVADILASSELPEALRGDPAAWAACVAGAVSASDYVEGLRAAGFSQVSAARAETDEADEPSAAGADRLPVYAAVIAATKPPASASMIR